MSPRAIAGGTCKVLLASELISLLFGNVCLRAERETYEISFGRNAGGRAGGCFVEQKGSECCSSSAVV